MKRSESVTKSVTQTSNFHWHRHRFKVRWVEHPRDVPEYDVSRYPDILNLLVHEPELSENDWKSERALMTKEVVKAKIGRATKSGYPRLVISLDDETAPLQTPTSQDLLKDLRALYRVSKSSDPLPTNSNFRNGVLELAEKYTPFASLIRFGAWEGLTLEAWLDLVTKVYVYDKLLNELNEVDGNKGGIEHVKAWVEGQSQAAQNKSTHLARWWKHLENAYFNYVDAEDATLQRRKRERNVPKIKDHKQFRHQIARDLHNRMTGGYRFSLVSLPTDTFDNRYMIACEVGISEWADFLLSQKFPKIGHTKICEVCGKTFDSKKRDGRLCSSRCRTAKHRAKKG